MKNTFSLSRLALALTLAGAAGLATAAPIYVGSWKVDDGAYWGTVPAAYTGQEAAAFLFGGTASDYAISTVDALVININNLAWVSTWGGACGGSFPCGTQVAENFKVSTGGLYANVGDTSAYVQDWAIGERFTNYAFRIDRNEVPEPTPLALLGMAAVLAGWAAKRRKA
jgi:hypothetical protein